MKHRIEMFGPNNENLGRVESDEAPDIDTSYANIKQKIADHIISNKIKTIQIAFCWVNPTDWEPNQWMPIPQGLALSLIQNAVMEHRERIRHELDNDSSTEQK